MGFDMGFFYGFDSWRLQWVLIHVMVGFGPNVVGVWLGGSGLSLDWWWWQ